MTVKSVRVVVVRLLTLPLLVKRGEKEHFYICFFMIEAIKEAIGLAWDLLFAKGGDNGATAGVVIRFMGLLTANPIFLLPFGFYLIVMGIKSTRKLVTGY